MPGTSKFAGDPFGRDAILGRHGEMGEETGGTFRAALQDLRADGPARVVAKYRARGERDGKTLGPATSSRSELRDNTITDITDTTADEASWDAFWS